MKFSIGLKGRPVLDTELDRENYYNMTTNYQSLTRLEVTFNKLIKQMGKIKQEIMLKGVLVPVAVAMGLLVIQTMFYPAARSAIGVTIGFGFIVFYYTRLFFGTLIQRIFLKLFMAVNPGIFVLIIAGAFVGDGLKEINSVSPIGLIIAIIMSGLVFYALENLIKFFTFKSYLPQKLELDYAMKIFKAIMQEFPDDQSAFISFNPFLNKWSQKSLPDQRKRWGYTYHTSLDLIGQLNMKVSENLKFDMRILSFKERKVKNRKSKFKGCKYKMIYDFSFRFPQKNLKQDIDISEKMWKRLQETYRIQSKKKEMKLIPGTVFPDPFHPTKLKIKASIRNNKLNVRLILKSNTYEKDELKPVNFLPPILVLQVIRVASTTLMSLEEKTQKS